MTDQILPGDLTQVDTVARCGVGTRYSDPTNGNVWQYVKAGGTIAQYEYVSITEDGNFTAVSLTTTTNPNTEPSLVGCLQASGGLTSGKFAFVQRKGSHTGKFAASCVQDVKIFTTATAGVVDDASTTLINGLKLLTTIVGAASSLAHASVEMTTVVA